MENPSLGAGILIVKGSADSRISWEEAASGRSFHYISQRERPHFPALAEASFSSLSSVSLLGKHRFSWGELLREAVTSRSWICTWLACLSLPHPQLAQHLICRRWISVRHHPKAD